MRHIQSSDGHRVGKNVNGQTTKYVYDGDTIIAEVGPTGTTTYELPGIGYVVGGVQSYYQDNAPGSTLSVQSKLGVLQSRNEYDAYGISYSLVAGPQTDLGYVGSKGYITDTESGLLQLGHRYYLPILGRFLNQDPTGQKDDLNLYEYCKGNPVVGTDPTGFKTFYWGIWSDTEANLYNAIFGGGVGFGRGLSLDTNGTLSFWSSGQLQLGIGTSTETGAEYGYSPGNTFVGPTGFGASASWLPGVGGQLDGLELQQTFTPSGWPKWLIWPHGSASPTTSISIGPAPNAASLFGFLNSSGSVSVNLPTVVGRIWNQSQNFYKQLMSIPGAPFSGPFY